MIDANWLKAFTLPLKATFGVAVASSVLLVFDRQELLQLKDFGTLISPSVVVVAVISWALVLASLLDLALSPLREK